MGEHRTRRRRVLKGAGGLGLLGLGGCLGGGTTTPPSGRRVTELCVEGVESAPVSIAATPTRTSITPDRTAEFDLTVTGRSENPVTLAFGNHVPFGTPQYSTPPGLLLLPAEAEVGRRTREAWLPRDGAVVPGEGIVVRRLPAGETATGTWAVWGDPDHVSFIEPGTYRFETRFTVGSTDDPVEWTLTLTVAAGSPEG